MNETDRLRTTKKGAAVLATVMVQTLEQHLPGFQNDFLRRLAVAYAEIRHDDAAVDGLELIRWTQSMLTGFSQIEGQGEPFLSGFDRPGI